MEDRPPEDLAIRAQGGDEEAYAQLVRVHRDLAFRVAYVIVGSAAEAEDAVQEAFVKAYHALPRFRSGSDFRPWLLKIVGNQARNSRRSAGRRLHYENRAVRDAALGGEVLSPETATEALETRCRLLAAVNLLPPRERLVVAMRYFLELSEAETATAAGIPRGTVKSRLSRAIGRLRNSLGEGTEDG